MWAKRRMTFNPGGNRRSDTTIESSDIKCIARQFFMNYSLQEIADSYNVEREIIKRITNGKNFAQEWGRAVVALIDEGVDVSRKPERIKPKMSPRLQPEVVKDIRKAHMESHTTSDVLAKEKGVSLGVFADIVTNKTYTEAEFIPEGWKV